MQIKNAQGLFPRLFPGRGISVMGGVSIAGGRRGGVPRQGREGVGRESGLVRLVYLQEASSRP